MILMTIGEGLAMTQVTTLKWPWWPKLQLLTTHFEPTGGLQTINNMTYYSFLQLYMFKQKIIWREVSERLSVVISYDFKIVLCKGVQ